MGERMNSAYEDELRAAFYSLFNRRILKKAPERGFFYSVEYWREATRYFNMELGGRLDHPLIVEERNRLKEERLKEKSPKKSGLIGKILHFKKKD